MNWSWENVKSIVSSLSGRLGFKKANYLKFLRLILLLENGEIFDEITNDFIKRSDYKQKIYYILYEYAKTEHDYGETGKLIPYTKIFGGTEYLPLFRTRVLNRLENIFKHQPELLLRLTEIFTAIKMDLGDYSIKLYTLPRIPIVIVLWKGDEEVPPGSNILFDSSITTYLNNAETVVHLCELAINRMRIAVETIK